jgi:protein-disulfide isomerase
VLTVEPQVVERYVRPGTAKLVFRDVLNHGERGERASEAAASAGRQGQFWALHAILFEEQPTIEQTSIAQIVPLLRRYAAMLPTLDQTAFARSMDERATLAAIKAADAEQRKRGITSQPIFEIGTRRLLGLQSLETIGRAIEDAAQR